MRWSHSTQIRSIAGDQVKQYPEHLKGNTALLNLLRSRGRLKNQEVASVPGEICEYFRQFFSPRSRYYVSTFTTSALLLADLMFVIGRIWRRYKRSRSGSIAVGS
jgi:hypothetical protein